MIKKIREYLQRKNKRLDKDTILDILGTESNISEFARIWERQGENIEILTVAKLTDYTTNPNSTFDNKELKAFMAGQASVAKFFFDCWLWMENEKQKNDQSKPIK